MQKLSDNELIGLYRHGNEEAFAILVRRHVKPLYFFARSLVGEKYADDMVQETFIKVWKHLKKFDNQKSFKVWVYRIARNTCYDWLRKKQPLNFSELTKNEDEEFSPEEVLPDLRPGAFEKVVEREQAEKVSQLLQKLHPDVRAIFQLHYYDGMAFSEIAEVLGLSINTVKSRHFRGLKGIRDELVAPESP